MKRKLGIFYGLLLLLVSNVMQAQLGFCNGSKGLPIFFENFGSGTDFGPPLPAGTTSYTYVAGTPNDGQYTLYYQNDLNDSWHNSPDHTPNNEPDGNNGKSLIVNASYTAGEFYKRTVSGLCVNTTFEFTAWLMNVFNSASGACTGTGIPINVTFEIYDASETTLLASGSTNDINGTPTPIWTQYGLTFTTLPTQTSVVLVMKNNGIGGCGNDLAIDDIMFRSCGEETTIVSDAGTGSDFTICGDDVPATINLTVTSSGTTAQFYQWQESVDNVTWTDIPAENGATYSSNVTADAYFRVKVAEDPANLTNPYCFTFSDIFTVTVVPQPVAPVNDGDQDICDQEPIPTLSVTPNPGESVDWFDAATAGNLLQANSNTFTPTVPGTYYAETYIPNTTCRSNSRTAVTFSIREQPFVVDGTAVFCEGFFADISAEIDNVEYLWNTGETTKEIRVTTPGIYTVVVTNSVGCSSTRIVTVTQISRPVIQDVLTENSTVTIVLASSGDYEFSLDNLYFQDSNVFNDVTGGVLTAYARGRCGKDTMVFDLVVLPKFFTPNNDGYNDVFQIEGTMMVRKVKIAIFDRQGQLLTYLDEGNASWDGTFNGNPMPSSDYWYRANFIDGSEMKGHFSLIR